MWLQRKAGKRYPPLQAKTPRGKSKDPPNFTYLFIFKSHDLAGGQLMLCECLGLAITAAASLLTGLPGSCQELRLPREGIQLLALTGSRTSRGLLPSVSEQLWPIFPFAVTPAFHPVTGALVPHPQVPLSRVGGNRWSLKPHPPQNPC